MLGWMNLRGVKEFLWSSLLLASALLLAVLSQLAQHQGEQYAAVFLAVLSLILATVVCVTLIPKLLLRLRLDFLNHLQFFRFTRRGAFFILIILIIAFSTFNTGNNLLVLILSFLLASLLVSGIISNLVLRGLKISLAIPESIHAGQKATLFITLRNLKKLFPSLALKLKGRSEQEDLRGGTDFYRQEKHFPYLRGGEQLRLKLRCQFSRRGIYPVAGFEVTTTFPFGFFTRGRELEARGNIVVYPALQDLQPLFLCYAYLQGLMGKGRKGAGSTLYNIRDYQNGDSARFVHWKSTARVSRLMIKDFAQEEENPVQIVFSNFLPEPSQRALEQFEKTVSYIASLGHYSRTRGQKFAFASGDFEVVLNGRNQEYEAFMEYLAQVQPSDRPLTDLDRLKVPCLLFAAGDSMQVDRYGIHKIDFLTL